MSDLVNFELAQKLKEKGFREECIAYYHTDGELLYNRDLYRGGDYKSLLMSYNSLPKNPIGCEQTDAPTISQVLKWLRKEKKIHITANMHQDESEDADGRIVDKWCFWNWDIQSCISGNFLQDGDDAEYESYEYAIFAGIEYVINNLI